MEKGSFRQRLQEGVDNLPNLGAIGRAFSGEIRHLDIKQVAQITGLTIFIGGFFYSLYEVGQFFSAPTPAPRAADNPKFADPTALSLRPKVSEVVTAASLGIEQFDKNHLEGRINPLDSNTFMNKGIASCKTGVALDLEYKQTVIGRALSFLSPTVAEAAPLEAESAEDLIRCVQDIEKQRVWFSRFDIKVNQWNRGNFMGVQSIKEWRQEVAGEIRKKGFDMTPEEMGSFIGDFIPVAIVDPVTGKVGTITLEFVDDKAEADRRGIHWTGENMAMFFDDATEQIGAVLVNQDPLKKCHNGLIPFALRAKEVPPTKTAVPPTPLPTSTPQPSAQPEEEGQPSEEEGPAATPTPTQQPGKKATPTAIPTPTRGAPQPTEAAPTAGPVVIPTRGAPSPEPESSPVISPAASPAPAPSAAPMPIPTRGR